MVLLHSFVHKWLVRFWKKESRWLWLGVWVLYFDRVLKITYLVLWGGLVSDIELRKYVVTWPGEFVRASNGDIGTLQICIYFCMFWVLFFSQISINSNECCWIINNIYFVSTCNFLYQTNCLRVAFRLPKKGPPPFKMTRQICRTTAFDGHCWFECSFIQGMFHTNKSFLKLSLHWYQYLYVCAIL